MCHPLLQSRSRTPRTRTLVGQNRVISTCSWLLVMAGSEVGAGAMRGGEEVSPVTEGCCAVLACGWLRHRPRVPGVGCWLSFWNFELQCSSLSFGNLMQFCVFFISSCKTITQLFAFHQSHHLKIENTPYLGVRETQLWLLCCLEWAPWCSCLFCPIGAADYLSLR